MNTEFEAPRPPYYAVIFTTVRTELDDGYSEAAKRILELAAEQPGFVGFETARQEIGISVSYWTSLDAIHAWRENAAHKEVQGMVRRWYKTIRVRVCRVEKDYGF